MPKYISDYSEDALEREYESEPYDIHNYTRNEYSYGCTVISYSEKVKKYLHVVTAIASLGLMLPVNYLVERETRQHVFTHYFYTKTGEELGSSKEEAIKSAASLGEQMMKEKKYSEASGYFNVAYYLCNDSRKKTFDEKRDSAEEELRRQREEKKRRDQEEKERKARQAKEREAREREVKERKERERNEKERKNREREAQDLFQKAQEKWNEAFELENNISETEAKEKFEESNKLFLKATTILPNQLLYSNWYQISCLKLAGDKFFNEGVSLQEQGNSLRQQHKYEEALIKYGKALENYREGLNKSKDTRFKACMEVVEACIKEVQELINEKDLEETVRNIQVDSSRNEGYTAPILNENITVNQVIDS